MYLHVCMYMSVSEVYVCIGVHKYIYKYTRTHVNSHTPIHTHTQIYIYVHIIVNIYMCMYLYIYTCIHIHVPKERFFCVIPREDFDRTISQKSNLSRDSFLSDCGGTAQRQKLWCSILQNHINLTCSESVFICKT